MALRDQLQEMFLERKLINTEKAGAMLRLFLCFAGEQKSFVGILLSVERNGPSFSSFPSEYVLVGGIGLMHNKFFFKE